MQSNNEKTLNAEQFGDSREEGNRNTYQGVPMNISVPRNPAHFETAIRVAGYTVTPNQIIGGDETPETVVALDTPEAQLAFSPEQACALAAALQAVAVHILEQSEEVAAA